jgi:hypothetical protein
MKQVVLPADIEMLATQTVNASFVAHRALGPGLLEKAYRLDLLINQRLLVELKAVDATNPIHRAQVTTYLKLLRLPLGLLINFNVPLIKGGITRVLNLDFQS